VLTALARRAFISVEAAEDLRGCGALCIATGLVRCGVKFGRAGGVVFRADALPNGLDAGRALLADLESANGDGLPAAALGDAVVAVRRSANDRKLPEFEAGDCAGRRTADGLRDVAGFAICTDGFAAWPNGLDNALVVFLVKSVATSTPAVAVFFNVSWVAEISEPALFLSAPAPALSEPAPALTEPRRSLKLLLVA